MTPSRCGCAEGDAVAAQQVSTRSRPRFARRTATRPIRVRREQPAGPPRRSFAAPGPAQHLSHLPAQLSTPNRSPSRVRSNRRARSVNVRDRRTGRRRRHRKKCRDRSGPGRSSAFGRGIADEHSADCSTIPRGRRRQAEQAAPDLKTRACFTWNSRASVYRPAGRPDLAHIGCACGLACVMASRALRRPVAAGRRR